MPLQEIKLYALGKAAIFLVKCFKLRQKLVSTIQAPFSILSQQRLRCPGGLGWGRETGRWCSLGCPWAWAITVSKSYSYGGGYQLRPRVWLPQGDKSSFTLPKRQLRSSLYLPVKFMMQDKGPQPVVTFLRLHDGPSLGQSLCSLFYQLPQRNGDWPLGLWQADDQKD